LTEGSLPVETRFGSFHANPGSIITLPDGLPGFEKCRRFILVSSPTLEPFTCLQGLDDAKPSFLAIDPRLAEPRYKTTLTAGDRRRLDVAGKEPLLWLGLVRLKGEAALVNLRAPVVINPRRMIGLQVIDADSPHATDHQLQLD
jgi:flagellar assembly factor FliW